MKRYYMRFPADADKLRLQNIFVVKEEGLPRSYPDRGPPVSFRVGLVA